jgi:formyl-CoA transferase
MGGARHGPDFQNIHRNKRGLTLNLKHAEGTDVLMRMVDQADVLVENFRPDVKRRLGIDYESLAERNSRIILASISGFGQSGPYANRPGFDQVAQGMGGLMSITGLPGQGPVRVGVPIADLTAGMYTAIGILIALLQREETGKGQWVYTSLLEAQIAMLDFQAARWLIGGEVPPQAGNNHPTSTPTGVFATADGFINIASAGETMWERLCGVLLADDLFKNPNYATERSRHKHRDALNEDLAHYLQHRTSQDWIDALNDAGVPSGPIYAIDEMFADPQVEHVGMAKSVQHPELGEIQVLKNAVNLSSTPDIDYRPTPERGEHTDSVLAEFGYGGEEIERLRVAGVI